MMSKVKPRMCQRTDSGDIAETYFCLGPDYSGGRAAEEGQESKVTRILGECEANREWVRGAIQ